MTALRLILVLILGSILLPNKVEALVSSNGMGGGAWSASPSWDSGVPICGDSILIRAGDIVTIASQQDYSACGSPMVLIIDGIMNFPGNGPKLKLPAGSTIIVNVGGLISANGGGNGNKISIGETWVWEKSDGDVPGYACFGSCGPLPVQFFSVEVLPHEKSVCVTWITLTESNNDFFTVERSSDGFNFESLVIIEGAGTSNIPIEYVSKDYEPLEGLSYYRIKQTDYDGEFEYSEVVAVEVNFQSTALVSVYPNPIRKGANIHVTVEGLGLNRDLRIVLQDINGELDYVGDFVASEYGESVFILPTQGKVHSGLYFVSIITDKGTEILKIVIR